MWSRVRAEEPGVLVSGSWGPAPGLGLTRRHRPRLWAQGSQRAVPRELVPGLLVEQAAQGSVRGYGGLLPVQGIHHPPYPVFMGKCGSSCHIRTLD